MRRSIILVVIVAIVVVVMTMGAFFLLQSSPALSIELNPPQPINVMYGEFSLDISVRNKAGLFIAEAKNVRGELELPQGFIEKSFQTSTRQLTFGGISAGDASHYGLNIIVSDSVKVGEHHGNLTIWGTNIPTQTIDIRMTVLSS